ncbi:MAG: type II secretion system protein [Sumerlaeia bacterium]
MYRKGPKINRNLIECRAIKRRAFTLVELLMVIGIITILAALAAENYLAAKIRANVTRVKSDFRTIAGAIELYRTDHNAYPRMADSSFYNDPAFDYIDGIPVRGVLTKSLTTPVTYMSNFKLIDPFMSARKDAALDEQLYTYQVIGEYVREEPESEFWPAAREYYGEWRLIGVGPDQTFGHGFANSAQLIYDPTNGLISFGNIFTSHYNPETQPGSDLLGEVLP